MKLAQSVRMGAWILVSLNIVMAFGSIWVFMRMAPVIETIIEQNIKSLQACEEMLSILAMTEQPEADIVQLKNRFSLALKRADNNITEKEEPAAIEGITKNYIKAFDGNSIGRDRTITAILYLSEINRDAMVKEDIKARQFGNAGAWGIVFMASAVFLVGMLFMRSLKVNLVKPLEEIHSVFEATRNGDNMRRCTGPDMHQDLKTIFGSINQLLDQNRSFIPKNKT